MWPLLHTGRRPSLVPIASLRFFRQCNAATARSLSYASARSDAAAALEDRSGKELLGSMPHPEAEVWPKGYEGRDLLDNAAVVPSVVWPESFSESDAYWRDKRQQQLRLEENFVYDAIEMHKKFVTDVRRREKAATLGFARDLFRVWFAPLKEAIRVEQEKILKSKLPRSEGDQYFMILEPDELAILTIHSTAPSEKTVLGMMLKGDPDQKFEGKLPFVTVAGRLGKAQVNLLKLRLRVERENRQRSRLNRRLSAVNGTRPKLSEVVASERLEPWQEKLLKRSIEMNSKIQMLQNRWKQKSVAIRDVFLSQWTLGKEQSVWSEAAQIQVGGTLINLFRDTCTVHVDKASGKLMGSKATSVRMNEPALRHEIIWQKDRQGLRQLGLLTIQPAVVQMIESTEAHSTWALTRSYPMVYPPAPWRSVDVGGYLSIPSRVVRSFDNSETAYLVKEADVRGDLDRVYQALTVLGRTPWIMNKAVFSVLEQVWKTGGGKLGLPSRIDVPLPQNPTQRFRLTRGNGALYATFSGETDLEAYFRRDRIARAKKKNAELHSLRCDMELKLAVARKFLEEERIYFPHNIDFRGRAYPIPPHLNHLGNDMCRGLLLFAEARPLGEKGLDWLYVQVANLYGAGENKKPLQKRVEFALQNLDKILDSANKPLNGLQWWMSGDSPWQLLATCMEIRDALKSENPETFLSRMHVHQDGSCNGLQHYAALARDATGATAVNLSSQKEPNDVYSEISDVVEKSVAEDAAKGHKWAQLLDGHVNRKLVKQSVMTSVYGVTFVGAREQIADRLLERGWEDNNDLFKVSAYAATVTMAGLHSMFRNAKDVKNWLVSCAGVIANAGHTVQWTTPLGLPVTQPYRDMATRSVKTVVQTVSLATRRRDMPVIKRKQKTAFPPNYIHSLDSTHMMMTAMGCHEQCVAFAGVHDSFWTHAGTVDTMNRILREKFYELHSRPLIQELREQFRQTYAKDNLEFPALPVQGAFRLEEIYDAQYFFN